jgi:hypothetical protein
VRLCVPRGSARRKRASHIGYVHVQTHIPISMEACDSALALDELLGTTVRDGQPKVRARKRRRPAKAKVPEQVRARILASVSSSTACRICSRFLRRRSCKTKPAQVLRRHQPRLNRALLSPWRLWRYSRAAPCTRAITVFMQEPPSTTGDVSGATSLFVESRRERRARTVC